MDVSALPMPFVGLSWWAIAIVYAGYLFGAYIRGAFGFGSNLPSVLVSAWVLPPHHAVLLITVVAGTMQIQLLPQGIRGATYSRVIPVIIAMTMGGALGVWLLTFLKGDWLLIVLAVVVFSLVMMDVYRIMERVGRRINIKSPRVTSGAAVVSSTVGTLSGGGAIYLLVPFLKAAATSPLDFRSSNIMIAGISMLIRLLMLSTTGLITFELIVDAVALMPAVFLGVAGGTRFFKASAPEQFFKALQWVMLIAASLLLIKGLFALNAAYG